MGRSDVGVRALGAADVAWTMLFVVLLMCKVLWGFWTRDLTFGDTSSYFRDASIWADFRQNNIIWSPLYTAYFGFVWDAFRDAEVAVLVHRLLLLLVAALLVAWVALVSLPRTVAVLLLVWWIALPIHYDTLYEVHLFGSLPLLVLLLVGLLAPDRWRYALWLGVAFLTTMLIRNEYIILVFSFGLFFLFRLVWGSECAVQEGWKRVSMRLGLCLGVPVLIAALAFQFSYVKTPAQLQHYSSNKHTLNMCQVYAFGYQQRYPEWVRSPWTECHGLMENTFGERLPTLGKMVASNPTAVGEHFLWNLSLLPSGLELLLFNVVGGDANPDYTKVPRYPLLPHLALLVLVSFGAIGFVAVLRRSGPESDRFRVVIRRLAPLLLGTVAMVLAVVVTQRPRPSYLLGFGVLLVWFVALTVSVWSNRSAFLDSPRMAGMVALAALIIVPSYASLKLDSKHGELGDIYSLLKPHQQALCSGSEPFALGDYAFELKSYLCSPERANARMGDKPILDIHSLAPNELADPANFADALERSRAGSIIVDPFLVMKNPGLISCDAIRDALLAREWVQLGFERRPGDSCIAGYVRSQH